jgi:hypothetical protein
MSKCVLVMLTFTVIVPIIMNNFTYTQSAITIGNRHYSTTDDARRCHLPTTSVIAQNTNSKMSGIEKPSNSPCVASLISVNCRHFLKDQCAAILHAKKYATHHSSIQ